MKASRSKSKVVKNQQVIDFLSFIVSEKGLSQNTAFAYERDLEQFLLFSVLKKKSVLEMTHHDLRDFISSLRKQEVSVRSIARKISTLKQFYKFLITEDEINQDPAALLSIVVKSKRLPKHLTIAEMNALLLAARGDNENEVRDRAMLEIWYGTGMRVSELANISIAQLDFEEGVVKIKGKGNRERLVPLSTDSQAWCLKYREIRHEWLLQHELKDPKSFFLTRLGKRFTRQGIWKIVKKYALKAQIRRKVWPHMIRHSFATHVLRGGADLRVVQEFLGHKSISTTEVYTHLDIENLKLMQMKYHPRD